VSRRWKPRASPLPCSEAFLLHQEGGLELAEIAALTGAGSRPSRAASATPSRSSACCWEIAMTLPGRTTGNRSSARRRSRAGALSREEPRIARRLDLRGAAKPARVRKPSIAREAIAERRRWWPLAAAATVAAVAVGVLQLTPPETRRTLR
jgi:hypothetical protein